MQGNNFDDKQISNDELKKFSEDHLRRLAGNNAGDQFGPLIAATTAAYTEFFGDLSEAGTAAAVREGLTIRVNDALEAFVAQVQRREGRIRDQWEKTSAEYQEFFPQGLGEYGAATLGDAERLMNRFGFGPAQKQDVFDGVDIGEPIDEKLSQIDPKDRVMLLAELEAAAAVDGEIDESELAILEDVRRALAED